jgi:hypothetical protein
MAIFDIYVKNRCCSYPFSPETKEGEDEQGHHQNVPQRRRPHRLSRLKQFQMNFQFGNMIFQPLKTIK